MNRVFGIDKYKLQPNKSSHDPQQSIFPSSELYGQEKTIQSILQIKSKIKELSGTINLIDNQLNLLHSKLIAATGTTKQMYHNSYTQLLNQRKQYQWQLKNTIQKGNQIDQQALLNKLEQNNYQQVQKQIIQILSKQLENEEINDPEKQKLNNKLREQMNQVMEESNNINETLNNCISLNDNEDDLEEEFASLQEEYIKGLKLKSPYKQGKQL